MLSIEEIKLLIEKLEKVKKEDLQTLIDSNLQILKDIELAVDANNREIIDRLDKTPDWFRKDLDQKKLKPNIDEITKRQIQTKIFQFSRSNIYNSLEIGPGNGMFSKEFRAWRLNYFLDILKATEKRIRKNLLAGRKVLHNSLFHVLFHFHLCKNRFEYLRLFSLLIS